MRYFLLMAALIALPASASAASAPYIIGGSSVLVATSTPANVYAAGGTVAVTTTVLGDLAAFGGSVVVDAPVTGDALLIGGSVQLASSVLGDARIVGGRINITDPINGDVFAIGGSVKDSGGGGKNNFITGGDITFTKGARGPLTLYGNTVSLDGTFEGDVTITSTGKITLSPKTIINGGLYYQAPERANIPAGAHIVGGAHYTGASYLPTTEEARAIALASFGVFLFVKILGALILAGLFAGLFPAFAARVIERASGASARRILLSLLLGFGIFVAVPVFCTLLALTFVGFGLAVLIGLAYLLLVPVAFIYTAVVLGSYLARYLFKRTTPRWSDAVFGMLVLFIVWSIPVFGWLVVSLSVLVMLGVLVNLLYRFAFPRDLFTENES